MSPDRGQALSVLVAHPSPDLYGSDRQLLQSVEGMRRHGWHVCVVLPTYGPLVPLLRAAGANDVRILPFPVLRKALLSPAGLFRLLLGAPLRLARMWQLLGAHRPDAVYVNTITIPLWLLAARMRRIPALCHVHEAEEAASPLMRKVLHLPLFAADRLIAISEATLRSLCAVFPRLERKTRVVLNGVAGEPTDGMEPEVANAAQSTRTAVVVARLSPRKGVDVVLEALALVRRRGYDLRLDVCGSAFSGYEWYEAELRRRSREEDLAGAVNFLGYVHSPWPVLRRASLVIVPSRVEPFGNTAVEGLLAARPVIASCVQGLTEIIRHEQNGLLVAPADPADLAAAMERLLADPQFAARLAREGRRDAEIRFSPLRYQSDIVAEITAAALRQ